MHLFYSIIALNWSITYQSIVFYENFFLLVNRNCYEHLNLCWKKKKKDLNSFVVYRFIFPSSFL